MLAELAWRSGLKSWVIDLFADQDTRRYSEQVIRVDSLDETQLNPALARFKSIYPEAAAVYGSGLERHPQSLEQIGLEFELLGNRIEIAHSLQKKRSFFELLGRLRIPHPLVSFTVPDTPGRWLIKPEFGGGGVGIRDHDGDASIESDMYWQRHVDGDAGSVLFLADGLRVRVVGFNTQWSESFDDRNQFIFSGVLNHSPLSGAQERMVAEWLDAIVQEIPLRGLNTLDFIVRGDRVYLLEINPRPSASMQLYDADLFEVHVEACRGRLDNVSHTRQELCAYQIIYAERSVKIPDAFDWPEYCRDLPLAGSIIRKGQPICSIIARDKNVRSIREQLNEIRRILFQSLS